MARSAGMNVERIRTEFPLLSIHYRSEGQSFMTTVHRLRDGRELRAIKGSPKEVLALCHLRWKGNKLVRLDQFTRKQILEKNEELARRGLRVLGFARQESEPVWLGLVAMSDALRPGIAKLVDRLSLAGIDSCMITGDQDLTAQAIGKVTGVKRIYSRVSPSQKLEIIRKMQRSGAVVAMIGDGINDGPALKAADVGIAMAEKGTIAASQSADVVLPSDNLDGIWNAIREGRTIHEETKKAIRYIVSQNLSEILHTFLTVALSGGEPFTPIQFLWINLVTDLFPELALAQEPAEAGIMKRKPAVSPQNFIGREDLGDVTVETSMLTGASLTAYLAGRRAYRSEVRAKSLAFLTLTASSLFYTTHVRSEHMTFFERSDSKKNKYIPMAIASGFLAELAGFSIPPP